MTRWAALLKLLTLIPWTCHYCQHRQYCSALLWQTVKYTLICERCSYQLSYPTHIRPQDPTPTPWMKSA